MAAITERSRKKKETASTSHKRLSSAEEQGSKEKRDVHAMEQRQESPAYELKPGVFGIIDDRVVVEKAHEGIAFSEFQRLAALLELTISEQAVLLSITERTMARRIAENGTLSMLESERLVLLQKLAEHGVDVFEDQGKFNRWLRRPLTLLNNKSPLAYLDMTTGFVVVDQLLGRLEYGVYS